MLSIGCALGVNADHKTGRRSTISRLQVDDLIVANVPVRSHADGCLQRDREEQVSSFQHLQRRANALHAAHHLVSEIA